MLILGALLSLGTFGETFPIVEEDMLEMIEKRIKEKSDLQKEASLRIQKKIRGSQSLGLLDAPQSRSFTWDPSYQGEKDLQDTKGQVFYKAGTKINPLHHVSLKSPLLFFKNPKHLKWALLEEKDARWILVEGSPLELEEAQKRPVFFDQGGYLIKKLGIHFVPAKVTQEGDLLRIEEIKVKDDSCD